MNPVSSHRAFLLRHGRASGFVLLIVGLAAGAPSQAAEASKEAPKSLAGLPVATLQHEQPVDFEKELLPILKNNCLACHNQTKAKAGLNLETPQLILKGGDSGPAAVPGKPLESLLFKAAAHLDPELIMPPKDNKANAIDLNPEQLALLRIWIDQGAKGEVHTALPVQWLDQPPALSPILAVALTRDGQLAACGRGNQIAVYHLPSGRKIADLADPRLAALPGFAGAAHRDLVNSLSFNADGSLLASSGYREVKLWRRPRDVRKFSLPLDGHELSTIAISPDRRWVASTAPDHSIAIHELPGGGLKHTLTGHTKPVTVLRFAPDGARLCSSSADKTVRIWNVRDGSESAFLSSTSDVRAVAWLAGTNRLAIGEPTGLVRVWTWGDGPAQAPTEDRSSVARLILVTEFGSPGAAITALEALPEGQHVLVGGADGVVRQWHLGTGKQVRELQHGARVTALAVRADGKRFASAGTNSLAKLWSGEDGSLVAEVKGDRYAYERATELERGLAIDKVTLDFHKQSLAAAETENKSQRDRAARAAGTNTLAEKAFEEKDKLLKEARIARQKSDQGLSNLLAEIRMVTESFEQADRAAREASSTAKAISTKAIETQLAAERAALSRIDAERIALDTAGVSARTKAAAGNVDAAKETAERIAQESAAVAERSKAFAEAIAQDAQAKSRTAAETKAAAEKAIERLASLAFAAGQLKPAYEKILAEGPERRVQATNLIEAASKALAAADEDFKKAETRRSVTGHELELALLAVERTSNTLVIAKTTVDASLARQKSTSAALELARKAATAAEQPIHSVAFSPDGRTLATVGEDRRVHTWSAENGTPFEVLGRWLAPESAAAGTATEPAPSGEGMSPPSVEFLDPDTVLAVADGSRLVGWDLNPRWTFERAIGTGDLDSPLGDRVNAVRFSPDGSTLATGGGAPTRSGEIKLWQAADGLFLRELQNVHSDSVLSLEFSPDGKYLASASADRFVRVCDLATGKVVKAFEGHTSYVLGVAWKSDSRTLASAGADNMIKIWDLTTGERRRNIDGAAKEVTSIFFVGITDQALASSGDNQVRLLRENGEKVRSFEGATDFVNSAMATPDGRWVVAGGQDGILRVWGGPEGKLLASLGPSRKK